MHFQQDAYTRSRRYSRRYYIAHIRCTRHPDNDDVTKRRRDSNDSAYRSYFSSTRVVSAKAGRSTIVYQLILVNSTFSLSIQYEKL